MTIVMNDFDSITIEYKGTKFFLDAVPPPAAGERDGSCQPHINLVPHDDSNGRVVLRERKDDFGDNFWLIERA